MNDDMQPRNRAERRAAGRRARRVAAVGSGAMLAVGAAGVATTLLASTPATAAAPIVVTNLADSGSGSLRDAINQANTAAGQDTITFATGLSGTITLASDLPHITDALAIEGPGASVVTVDGANQFALFNFYGVTSAAGADSVSGLTLTHGVAHNKDGAGSGGAITDRNGSADMTITDSVIVDNHAGNDGGGVQFYNASGNMTITGSTISGNQAGGGGGGLYAWGAGTLDVTISNSTISGNSAGGFGGGLYAHSATVNVDNSTISGNSAGSNGRGGGLRVARGTLGVDSSTISGNTARDGGGIHLYDTGASITTTTISGNTATGGGGGGIMVHYDDGTGATLMMRNSTVSGNHSQYYGGGLYVANSGVTTIENSTISGNDAAQAGGIFSYGGGTTLTQVTISANAANAPKRGNPAVGGVLISGKQPGAGAASPPGAAHADASASTKTPQETARLGSAGAHGVHAAAVDNVDSVGTIVAGNTGEDIGSFRSGTTSTVNSDHSVLGTVAGAVTVNDLGGTQQGVTDAGLGPLGNNGGPTQTMALLPGSVAINKGPVPVPVFPGNDFDQRGAGFARVVDGVVDVGAYEVQPPAEEAPAAVVITPKFTG